MKPTNKSKYAEGSVIFPTPGVGSYNIPRYMDNIPAYQTNKNSHSFHANSNNNMTSSFKSPGRSKLLMNDAVYYCTNPEYEEDYVANSSVLGIDISTLNNNFDLSLSQSILIKSASLGKLTNHKSKGSLYDKPWLNDKEKDRINGINRKNVNQKLSPEERMKEILEVKNLP